MDISHLVDGLNEQQREIVCAEPSNCLVLAGAGSGKTRVLVHRIAWLIEVLEVSPHSVLAITFTNKAAGEMKARIADLVKKGGGGIWCGTFHAICLRILKQHHTEANLTPNFTIIDTGDQKRFIKRVIEQLNLDKKKFTPDGVIGFINKNKEQGLRAATVKGSHDYMHNQLLKIYERYEILAAQENLVDFGELLLRTHELLSRNEAIGKHYSSKFKHILVDEFQDTNGLQCALIHSLQGKDNNNYVMAVGDEDQSIYGWRGADIGNVLNFDKLFNDTKTFRLEKNYRSTENILKAANAVISNNSDRFGKELWSDIKDNALIEFYRAPTDRQEASFLTDALADHYKQGGKLNDCAIFYRTNAQSRIIEETLIHHGIPYRVYGGLRFYDRAEIKNVIAYMRLIVNRSNTEAMLRIINLPTRGLGSTTISKINDLAQKHNISLWDTAKAITQGAPAIITDLNKSKIAVVQKFLDLIDKIDDSIRGMGLQEQTSTIIKLSGLEQLYNKNKDADYESARDNLQEFVNAANIAFNSDESSDMEIFLDNIALESGSTQAQEYEDSVQLMTIHASKGLEFLKVFMTGMEEGLFPLEKSAYDDKLLQEERRLCYVGMTRACRHLCITCCEARLLYGRENYNPISRFIEEVPKELIRNLNDKKRTTLLNNSMIKLKVGTRVNHPTFGYGEVTNTEDNGHISRVQIDFEHEGSKWLVTEYAQLQIL
ncbi:MAG: UvrD-helicase domain-containing protein [Candidatus Portiera sp.]|nr:UvrD-helicase domain-containing protein [Portiera sp.]